MPKAKRIEDMSEEELIRRSGEAYDKARTTPEPGGFDSDVKPFSVKPIFDRAIARGKDMEAAALDRASRMNPMGDTYKVGGKTASARADGIAQRGKTRGTIVMCGGGKAYK